MCILIGGFRTTSSFHFLWLQDILWHKNGQLSHINRAPIPLLDGVSYPKPEPSVYNDCEAQNELEPQIPTLVLAFWQQKNKNAPLISPNISFSTAYSSPNAVLDQEALMFLWPTPSTAFGDNSGMHIKVMVLAKNKMVFFFSKKANFINPGSFLHRCVE